jgi:NADPH:quinone reductase-like Zn-dependent oxidoreductase
MDVPLRQRQWVQTARGLPFDVLHLVDAEVLRPSPRSGDVLVKVKAVAFNQESVPQLSVS